MQVTWYEIGHSMQRCTIHKSRKEEKHVRLCTRSAMAYKKMTMVVTYNEVPFGFRIEHAGGLPLALAAAASRFGSTLLGLNFVLLLFLEVYLGARPALVRGTHEQNPIGLILGRRSRWPRSVAVRGRIVPVERVEVDNTVIVTGVAVSTSRVAQLLDVNILHREASRVKEKAAVGPGAARDVFAVRAVILAEGAPMPTLGAVRAAEVLGLVGQARQADARVVEQTPAAAVAN
jgi:hypothetical protein